MTKHLKVTNPTRGRVRLFVEPYGVVYPLEPGASVDLYSEFDGESWIEVGVDNGLEGLTIVVWATEKLVIRAKDGTERTIDYG